MAEAEYEAEQAVLGDLSRLDESSTSFRLDAGSGRSAEEVAALLARVRLDDPAEPFWRGVRSIREIERHVEVELNEPYAPMLAPVDGVQVECNLYDVAALDKAEAAAAVDV
jgi:peptide/nickel transport system ATP-binding protein